MSSFGARCNCGWNILGSLDLVSECLLVHKFLGCSAHETDKRVTIDEEVKKFITKRLEEKNG